MDMSPERIGGLVANLSESLNVEIKRWIDPTAPEGIAKIARAAIALRNRNGGYLVIGFDDGTLQPDPNRPADVRATFHVDVVQGIVSRYSHDQFEIQVGFAERDGLEYPVIGVPEGVRSPVAAKRDLNDASGKAVIREDAVYFRTLGSNGTPSTSLAKRADWSDLVEICFENREADFGRFLRRQLGHDGLAQFLGIASELNGAIPSAATLETRTRDVLLFGQQRRDEAIKKRKLSKDEEAALLLGSWEVALVIAPPRDVDDSSKEFFQTIAGANPRYTGWPAWLDARNFRNTEDHPRKIDGAWETLVVSLASDWNRHFDFYRMAAKGEFYQWRIMEDDLTDKVEPKTALEPTLVIRRVAEVIAVGLSFARALKCEEGASLGLLFRWNGIDGRELSAWAGMSYFSDGQVAHQDAADGFVEVPADTPVTAIAPYVAKATSKLFSAFDGFEFPTSSLEQWVNKLLSRQ
jgi:hypothetical protein